MTMIGGEEVYDLGAHIDDRVLPSEPTFDQLKSSVQRMVDNVSPAPQAVSIGDWRVYQLARDMCRIMGHDPDQLVVDVKNVERGPLGSTPVRAPVPACTLYLEMARGVVETLQRAI